MVRTSDHVKPYEKQVSYVFSHVESRFKKIKTWKEEEEKKRKEEKK